MEEEDEVEEVYVGEGDDVILLDETSCGKNGNFGITIDNVVQFTDVLTLFLLGNDQANSNSRSDDGQTIGFVTTITEQ